MIFWCLILFFHYFYEILPPHYIPSPLASCKWHFMLSRYRQPSRTTMPQNVDIINYQAPHYRVDDITEHAKNRGFDISRKSYHMRVSIYYACYHKHTAKHFHLHTQRKPTAPSIIRSIPAHHAHITRATGSQLLTTPVFTHWLRVTIYWGYILRYWQHYLLWEMIWDDILMYFWGATHFQDHMEANHAIYRRYNIRQMRIGRSSCLFNMSAYIGNHLTYLVRTDKLLLAKHERWILYYLRPLFI